MSHGLAHVDTGDRRLGEGYPGGRKVLLHAVSVVVFRNLETSSQFSCFNRRNQSALLAFTIPKGWKQGAGLSIVATHIDSPNLRVSDLDSHRLHLLIGVS